ncbi:L,D-transpeptidase family protein [Micromonospora terminaliae]|uniref:L,D-transpeptidase family protein n=1 Tax=Micromonospora terminaliae TaxID=1914461 RepID=A0AAJ2ZCQ8_9ACTN|nr:L,D-transpeptidase family protein [Micromonospora terminaliae]NES26363.1 L,D-transpeptidase family protein [Micromonospora terminaliae]QGL50542.1 L,D-transpeptidase family protein [Micromonospora terminaliae]
MKRVRFAVRAVCLAAVVLVGVGACARDPQAGGTGAAAPAPVGVTEEASGASAPPTPEQPAASPSATPSRTTTPKPSRTTPKPATPKPSKPAGCPEGEQQKAVETYLSRLGGFGTLSVDGKQSAADCAAIKKFQIRYGISPATGRAGPTTYDVAKRLANTDTGRCNAGSRTTFCVDLTHQTVWAMRGGKVVMGPTVTRTGMAGYATPTGTYSVGGKNMREWSNPYEVWLPYWQRFNGGIGFHETTTYLHNGSIGSHGCVNLLHRDAVRLWELGSVGTRVVVFGHRPGT